MQDDMIEQRKEDSKVSHQIDARETSFFRGGMKRFWALTIALVIFFLFVIVIVYPG